MAPSLIVFVVFLGCYTAALIYLNSKKRLDAEGRGYVDKEDSKPDHPINAFLKGGVSAAGLAILSLLVLMILIALLLGYSFFFDPQFLE